jgi:4-hydroxy-4-methyl-2-oxoglutarate aldolase
MSPQDLVDRLKRLDTGAVSDALDKLGLEGTIVGIGPLSVPHRIAGRVVTVKLGPFRGETPKRHLGTAAVEASGPGDVIVVEHRSRDDCAGWGGVLSRAARARGIEGTIVDGGARDLDESRELRYPVFARAATPRTARGRVVEEGWNVPVRIGDVEVRSGDLVIADATGVVFLEKSRAENIIEAAEAIASREGAMARAVDAGTPVGRVMGGEYEKLLGERNDG